MIDPLYVTAGEGGANFIWVTYSWVSFEYLPGDQ